MCKQVSLGLFRLLFRRGLSLTLVLPMLAVLPAVAFEPLEALANEHSAGQSATKQTPQRRTPRRTRPRRRIQRPDPPRRLPPNQVQPGGGLDAAADACTPDGAPLTALVPVENPVLTMRDRPTFLFYLPDAPETVDYAEFILLSADEKLEIYATQFSPIASGIVSVSLSNEAALALEPGQAYHWYLNLHCQTAAGVPSVNGWVQRVATADVAESGVNSLSTDSALPEVWYDEIAAVAASLRQSPQLTTGESNWSRWHDLLSAAGLDELVGVPVLGPISRGEVATIRD